MKGYIYKHTNKNNGKVYIGQTRKDPEQRWGKDGKNYAGQRAFYREIIRHGWDSFDHEILETFENDDETLLGRFLDKAEVHYIKKFESMNSSKGYNTVFKDRDLYARLTVPAKRAIDRYMKEGKTVEEAYELYKEHKRTGR